jgi:hypothetical protein
MNDASLAALYERYGHLVFKRCLRLLGVPADAEDTMHDVFLRAHRAPPPERSTPPTAASTGYAANASSGEALRPTSRSSTSTLTGWRC